MGEGTKSREGNGWNTETCNNDQRKTGKGRRRKGMGSASTPRVVPSNFSAVCSSPVNPVAGSSRPQVKLGSDACCAAGVTLNGWFRLTGSSAARRRRRYWPRPHAAAPAEAKANRQPVSRGATANNTFYLSVLFRDNPEKRRNPLM